METLSTDLWVMVLDCVWQNMSSYKVNRYVRMRRVCKSFSQIIPPSTVVYGQRPDGPGSDQWTCIVFQDWPYNGLTKSTVPERIFLIQELNPLKKIGSKAVSDFWDVEYTHTKVSSFRSPIKDQLWSTFRIGLEEFLSGRFQIGELDHFRPSSLFTDYCDFKISPVLGMTVRKDRPEIIIIWVDIPSKRKRKNCYINAHEARNLVKFLTFPVKTEAI